MKKRITFSVVFCLCFIFPFWIQAQESKIQDSDTTTSVDTDKNDMNDDIIRFSINASEAFRITGKRIEPVGTGSSIFFGLNAGLNDDLSNNINVFLGNQAGMLNTTGEYNVGIGLNSLRNNIDGKYNVALGNKSLQNSISSNNVAIGTNSLFFQESGHSNIAVGTSALYQNLSGNYNVALGNSAMQLNTTGSYNVGLGYGSLFSNLNGQTNVAIGMSTIRSNTTGNHNVGVGASALRLNTTGNHNVGIGLSANHFNDTGSNNTMIGFNAGKGESQHSKSGNVFIGYRSGFYETGSNKLYLENTDSDNPLIYGEFDNNIVKLNGVVGVNLDPTYAIDPIGNFKLLVAGDIRTQRVKVTPEGWADFVFADDYDLPTLKSVETFISKNKHLPDIPSEREVLDQGIYLDDMDAKLLQKVEELTLYLIAQEKRIDALETTNKELNETLKTLIARLSEK